MLSFLPKRLYRELTEITPESLTARGIRLLMLDFDNTMVPYTTDEPSAQLLAWLAQFRRSSVQLCIVSNSKKPRVRAFAQKYGVDCVTHARKPFPNGIRRCLRQYGCTPAQAALCGDQTYTDVLGANLAGVYSIQVRSIYNHNFPLKLRHVAELPFLYIARKRSDIK